MGLDFFRRALELQQTYRRPWMEVVDTLQANDTFLDDAWCHFFNKHNVLVGLSLDGPRSLHDAYRVDKNGRGTFDRVMRRRGLRSSQPLIDEVDVSQTGGPYFRSSSSRKLDTLFCQVK